MTSFKNGKEWYHHLVRSSTGKDHKFLLSRNPKWVLSRDTDANDGTKAYTSFDDHQSLLSYCAKYPDQGYYEHLILNDERRKLYFDIDHELPLDKAPHWAAMHKRHLGLLIETLRLKFTGHGLPFTPEDVRIYQSCGVKGDVYKFSYHVVTVGYNAISPEHVKEICSCIRESVAVNAGLLNIVASSPDKPVRNWIDTAPYGCASGGQAFRLINSAKRGSNRKKTLLQDEGCPPDHFTLYDTDGNANHYSRSDVWGTVEMESLICHPITRRDREAIPLTFCPLTPKKPGSGNCPMGGEQLEIALATLVRLYPELDGVFAMEGTPNKLKRLASALCPVCSVVHDNENAFLNLQKNGGVNFVCMRKPEEPLRVEGLVFEVEDDEELEDEEEVEEEIVSMPSKVETTRDSEATRAMDCHCSRIAYRETVDPLDPDRFYANNMSDGMQSAPTSFSARLPNPIYSNEYYGRDIARVMDEEGNIERVPTDAGVAITVIEHLVTLTREISTQFKLYEGKLVLFSTGALADQRASISFNYYLPSAKKVMSTRISVVDLLSGQYIKGHTWSGSVPGSFTALMRAKLYKEYDARRQTAYRDFERCYTKLGNPCNTPFFRGQPAPLPEPTSVNTFTGFGVNPLRFMKRYRSMAEFERCPEIIWIRILLQHGIAAGVVTDFYTAMDFLAFPPSHLDSPKTGKCMIVIGDYGTGKSTIGNIMKEIYGRLAINTNMARLAGTFNGSLSGCIFAMLDEPEPALNADGTTSAAQKAEAAKYAYRLKELVTGENMQLEDKYERARSEDMRVNFYMSSNNFDIAALDANPYSKDRRPIIFDSRTCCCRVWYDNGVRKEFFYFYATGKSNKCVDVDGVLLNPHPTPEQVREDKDYFYKTLLAIRRSPDFHDMFAAYLLTYAQENDTSRIHNYNQDPNSPALIQMRNLNVSYVTRFMTDLCGTDFVHNETPASLVAYPTRKDLKPYVVPDEDGKTPVCYFIKKKDLYLCIFKKWFADMYSGFRVPTLHEFEKDLALFCVRNPSLASNCAKIDGIDHRATFGDVKDVGVCFLTRSALRPNIFGPQTTTGTMPQQTATAQVDWQKMFEESERKRTEDMEAMKAMFAKLTQGK